MDGGVKGMMVSKVKQELKENLVPTEIKVRNNEQLFLEPEWAMSQ